MCGEGYLGQNSAYEFFGIGTATQIDYIKVSWLSGIVDMVESPSINSHMTLVEGSTLGIDNNALNRGFMLYPNPTYGQFILQVPETILGSEMMVMDMTGRVLFYSEIISKETTFNFATYTSGIYMVTLEYEGVTFSEKLILR